MKILCILIYVICGELTKQRPIKIMVHDVNLNELGGKVSRQDDLIAESELKFNSEQYKSLHFPELRDVFKTKQHQRRRRAEQDETLHGQGTSAATKGAVKYRKTYLSSRPNSNRNINKRPWMRAGWTSWGRWTPCSQTCGMGGVQTRRRFCANGSYGSENCPGTGLETKKCFITQCIYYEWSPWANWTKCTKSCGSGMRYRARSCHAQTAQKNQVSNEKCGKDLFWAYDTCNTQLCIVATKSANDAEHSYGKTGSCGVKQNPFRQFTNSNLNRIAQVQLRIAGGNNARHGDWPWQVSFQHRTCRKVSRNARSCNWKHLCGASIVDKKWVITAAHCIVESGFYYDDTNPGEDWSVVVGMDKLHNEQLGQTNQGTRIYLDKIKVHETYKFNYITHADIALLKLADTLEYNDYIQPICFPEKQNPQHGDMCHITGWGFTSGTGDELSYHLKQAQIPIVDFQECRSVDVWYRLLDGNVHMCGGDRTRGGTDSCGGDSGGPLSCQRTDGTFYLAGVTSFGFSDCGKKGHLGIYARMTTFEQWAKDTIKNDEAKSDYSPYYEDFHNLDKYRSLSKNKMANVNYYS